MIKDTEHEVTIRRTNFKKVWVCLWCSLNINFKFKGLKNGVSKDRYDDRRTGYDSRDLIDQNRYHAEDYGMALISILFKIKVFVLIGKQQGYADNYRGGVDDRFEVIRRPHSDLNRNQPFSRIRDLDNYDRYNPSSHWVIYSLNSSWFLLHHAIVGLQQSTSIASWLQSLLVKRFLLATQNNNLRRSTRWIRWSQARSFSW